MYYIGTHSGNINDQYVSSSRWFSGEVTYRPSDFKRRILSFHESKEAARKAEAKILSYIKEVEFGTKYYNLKNGRKKGTPASNKGVPMSEEQKKKISASKKGKPAHNKGVHNPHAAINGKKGAFTLSKAVTGRRKVIRDGTPTWAYPSDPDYPTT
jgi:hypothetical protein